MPGIFSFDLPPFGTERAARAFVVEPVVGRVTVCEVLHDDDPVDACLDLNSLCGRSVEIGLGTRGSSQADGQILVSGETFFLQLELRAPALKS